MDTKTELDGINAAIDLALNGHEDFDFDYTVSALSALFDRRATLMALMDYDKIHNKEATEF